VIRQPFCVCGGGRNVCGSVLEVVTALLLSILLLQETASAIRFGGIALVVAGIILLKGSAH